MWLSSDNFWWHTWKIYYSVLTYCVYGKAKKEFRHNADSPTCHMGFKMIINAPVGPAPRWSLNFNEQVLAFALADFNLVFGSPIHVHHSLWYKNICRYIKVCFKIKHKLRPFEIFWSLRRSVQWPCNVLLFRIRVLSILLVYIYFFFFCK